MQSYQLNLANFHNRKYFHGTSILKGVVIFLSEKFGSVTDFTLQFKRQVFSQPTLVITTDEIQGKAVYGTFRIDGEVVNFHLEESSMPLDNINNNSDIDLFYNEDEIEQRLVYENNNWNLQITEMDDIHLCYNVVSKVTNMELFRSLPGFVEIAGKHTWLVGAEFNNLDFLKSSAGTIAVSHDFTMINARCMKRKIFLNNNVVGARMCIYG